MKYIDVHCHLNLPEFDIDIAEVISRAKEKEVGMIVVGVDRESSQKAIELAQKYENIWAVIGLHPADNAVEVFDFDLYKKMAQHPRVVGIGECGFDYYHIPVTDMDRQRNIFEKHIQIANEVKKPLMLHIRNGKNGENAYGDAIEVLKKYKKDNPEMRGDVHFFAGNLDVAKSFIELGFKLSFTGVITFAHNYDEVIKNIPLNMIMSETDAPFVAPEPYRGGRNEPVYVIEVARKIAEIRGEPVDKVLVTLVENTKELFKI